MLVRRVVFGVVLAFGQIAWADQPNIVYIMSDELAYYELSHMGNQRLRTPTIDQFAQEGIRFTQALAAAPVCAPLRCALMTGKHMGHASVRANDGGTPLRAGEATIASVLKSRGYATGGFGKWGAGGRGSTGVPEIHGFDVFFGYYDQVHAHSFFPPYLVRNSQEVVLPGNIGGRAGETYSHYEIMKEALAFIRKNRERPFFCYLPITPPHGMYDIPRDDPAWELYRDDDWMRDESVSQEAKNYAAMVSMVDRNLKEVLDLLRELDLEDNTIVFFTGDNGGQDRFKNQQYPRGFFGPNVNPLNGQEFRGQKGSLYEGGLRIPYLVRWPGKISAGQVSDLLCSQIDVLPTLAELVDAPTPQDADGISFLPTLLDAVDASKQQRHQHLYWEYGSSRAVRIGAWKGVKPREGREWELYNLNEDISESNNVADANPEMVARMKKIADSSHTPVVAGTYASRSLHEKDRQAKWGASRPSPNKQRASMKRLQGEKLLPFAKLSIAAKSSENAGNDKRAAYAVDGRPETIWHSQFSPQLAKHPHELVIDLTESRTVSALVYLARQDNGWNGAFADLDICLSDQKNQFSGTIHKFRGQKTRAPQRFSFPAEKGRYVRIRVHSEVNGGPWASAADIGVEVE